MSRARFLQPDSIVPEPFNPQSLNRYSYVMNDPVNRIDPTGMSSILTGDGYYGESYGDFHQPPWERAAGIDLRGFGSNPTRPIYQTCVRIRVVLRRDRLLRSTLVFNRLFLETFVPHRMPRFEH